MHAASVSTQIEPFKSTNLNQLKSMTSQALFRNVSVSHGASAISALSGCLLTYALYKLTSFVCFVKYESQRCSNLLKSAAEML